MESKQRFGEYATARESRDSCMLECENGGSAGPRYHSRNPEITTRNVGQEQRGHLQTRQYHNYVILPGPHRILPAVTNPRREQRMQLKKHMTLGLMHTVTVPPGTSVYFKNMSVGTGIHTGKLTLVQQPLTSNQGTSQTVLLINQSQGSVVLPCVSVTKEPTQMFVITGQPQRPPAPSDTSSNQILQPHATLESNLPQPQVPGEEMGSRSLEGAEFKATGSSIGGSMVPQVSEQDLVAASEQQRRMEAAEALLALSNSRPM